MNFFTAKPKRTKTVIGRHIQYDVGALHLYVRPTPYVVGVQCSLVLKLESNDLLVIGGGRFRKTRDAVLAMEERAIAVTKAMKIALKSTSGVILAKRIPKQSSTRKGKVRAKRKKS